MSVDYFVAYSATDAEGKQVTGRASVITNRITSAENISGMEKSIEEQLGLTNVVVVFWRRYEMED